MADYHNSFSRRDWLRSATLGLGAASASSWLGSLAWAADTQANKPVRNCIVLWMSGGPSQMETFDPKPEHRNGGPTKAIETSVPGIQISENLPQVAKHMDDLAIIRSMSTKEGDHVRATYHLRTGYPPGGVIQYPTLGSFLSKELAVENAELPNFISISPNRGISSAAYSAGFLGPRFGPFIVGADQQLVQLGPQGARAELRVENLQSAKSITLEQANARLEMLRDFNSAFRAGRPDNILESSSSANARAVTMMRSAARKAFDLDEEPDALRDAYGRNLFGQGCLLARRLVERGVPFVEVSLAGVQRDGRFANWDSHGDNFTMVKDICSAVDPAWASLMNDLKERGLLDSTLIVWMGEFGRTPKINSQNGRDHFPAAWSAVLGGAGIQGGQVFGKTTDDGMEVDEHPVSVPDLMATICKALQLDPTQQNMSNVGRPIRLADPEGTAVSQILRS